MTKRWLAVVALLACKGGSARDAAPSVVATATAIAPTTAQADASWSPSAGRVHVDSPFPGAVSIVNDGDAAASVHWELPLEREDSGAWSRVHELTLMKACVDEAPPGRCVTVPAHGKVDALPWTGWLGCTQCGICRANAPARAGKYRAVAVECGSGARFEGPAMTLVEDGRFAKTPHVYAPANEPNAIVVDNESDEPASFRLQVDVAKLNPQNAFETIDKAGMLLSPDCFPDAGACVTVPAHGTVHTQAFRPGCARCSKCAIQSMKPGTYASTVQLCEGQKPLYNDVYGSVWHVAPFVVDASGTAKPAR